MKKMIAASAVVLAFMLSGCGEGISNGNTYSSETVTLNDGTTVECVMYSSGGVWCQESK